MSAAGTEGSKQARFLQRLEKYALIGWRAAMVTAVGFVVYRLSSAPSPDLPSHRFLPNQLNQRTLESKRSVAQPFQPAEPTLASPADENAIALPSNEQKPREIASRRTRSEMLTVGAVPPLLADE